MQKTQVCMFCRYRKTLSPSPGAASCCAGGEAPADMAAQTVADQHAHRATPAGLNTPAPAPQQQARP